MISRLKPCYGVKELSAIFSLEINDNTVIRFEKKFAELRKSSFALAFPFARMGFYTMLKSLPAKSKTILMPAYTCVVMADIASIAGYKIKFHDVGMSTIVPAKDIMHPDNKNAGILLLTDLFGNRLSPEDRKNVIMWARANNIIVIEDKAMNLNFTDEKPVIGSNLELFSFMLNKQISTLFGGMICTDDYSVYKTLHEKRDELFKKREIVENLQLRLFFISQVFGYNRLFYRFGIKLQDKISTFRNLVNYYDENKPMMPKDALFKLTNFQAKIGLYQLERHYKFEQKRKELFYLYCEELKKLKEVKFIDYSKSTSYPYFPILVHNRERFIKYMNISGVDVEHIFEYCIPNLNYYASLNKNKDTFDNSKYLAERMVNLPLYPSLTKADVKDICRNVEKYFKSASEDITKEIEV
jgi:dTDP-4-amino-4,6-dideoxygalactose transaminase